MLVFISLLFPPKQLSFYSAECSQISPLWCISLDSPLDILLYHFYYAITIFALNITFVYIFFLVYQKAWKVMESTFIRKNIRINKLLYPLITFDFRFIMFELLFYLCFLFKDASQHHFIFIIFHLVLTYFNQFFIYSF